MGRYAQRLKKAKADAAQHALDEQQSAAIENLLTQGDNAPSEKPSAKNLLYFATSTQKLYVSTGTSASSDWTEVKAADPS